MSLEARLRAECEAWQQTQTAALSSWTQAQVRAHWERAPGRPEGRPALVLSAHWAALACHESFREVVPILRFWHKVGVSSPQHATNFARTWFGIRPAIAPGAGTRRSLRVLTELVNHGLDLDAPSPAGTSLRHYLSSKGKPWQDWLHQHDLAQAQRLGQHLDAQLDRDDPPKPLGRPRV